MTMPARIRNVMRNVFSESGSDQELVKILKDGKLGTCDCSSCRLISTYYHLKKGGKFYKRHLKKLDPEDKTALLEYICLRSFNGGEDGKRSKKGL